MKYLVIAVALSLMAVSAFAGVMPEDVVEPTPRILETIAESTVKASEDNPRLLSQLIQFAFTALFILL
jgi:hypothetical protein